MPKKLCRQAEAPEPTKIDTAVSDACTRSGAFALLLSLALLSLIPYWLEQHMEFFAGRYLSLRLNLTTAIDQLDSDPYWLKYKAAHQDAELMTLEQLLKVQIEAPQQSSQPQSNSAPATKSKISPSGRPPLSPPSLRILTNIDAIHEIADFLTSLNDTELLTNSRKASGLFDYSIYRWVLKRDRLIEVNMPTVTIHGNHNENQPDNYAPARTKTELLKYLTLRDVRELARYELPKIENTVKLGGSGGKEIAVTPGSLPRNLYMASFFGQLLILFVIMYFRAFTSEAVLSTRFPVPGTLFGAFSRSPLSVLVFFIGIWTPVVASVGVTWTSRKFSLIVPCILTGIAVLSVQRILQRATFFKTLLLAWNSLTHGKLPFDNPEMDFQLDINNHDSLEVDGTEAPPEARIPGNRE